MLGYNNSNNNDLPDLRVDSDVNFITCLLSTNLFQYKEHNKYIDGGGVKVKSEWQISIKYRALCWYPNDLQ